ncbi:MAG: hypothetical protein ACK5CA_03130 [Cyanobacteriota bacterium]|jgi:hypothetical protein
MVILTSQSIAQYRSQLAQFPEALLALDVLEDCEGNLEDAALSLGIQSGQQPDRNDWLEGLAKRCRAALCAPDLESDLAQGLVVQAVARLMEGQVCAPLLATPIVLYVLAVGVESFCEPMRFKLR